MGLEGRSGGASQERAVGLVAEKQEMCHSGGLGLGHPVLWRGVGVVEQFWELGALGLVEGALKEEVWDVLC